MTDTNSALLDLDQFDQLSRAGEINTVVCATPDPYGRLVGKRLTVQAFRALGLEGTGINASSFVFAVDIEMNPLNLPVSNAANGWADIRLVPDLTTMRRVPWEPNAALVICDAYNADSDTLLSVAPRTILRTQIERAEQEGLTFKFASELEFYLAATPPREAWDLGYQNLKMLSDYRSDYQMVQACRDDWFIERIRNQMPDFGVPIESSKPEWGLGQQEVTLDYCSTLEMADRHVLFKYGIKQLAHNADLTVTFMAKPIIDEVGSSCHLHVSMWSADDQQSLCWSDAAAGGMSENVRLVRRRPVDARHRHDPDVRANSELLQALSARPVRGHRDRSGQRQQVVRVPARRSRAVVPGGEPHPRRRRQPVLRILGHHRRGARWHRPGVADTRYLRWQRMDGRQHHRRCRPPCTNPFDLFAHSKMARAGVRRRSVRPSAGLLDASELSPSTPTPSPTGNCAATTSASDRATKPAQEPHPMPIDPIAQKMLDDTKASGRPNAHLLPVETARQNFEDTFGALSKPPIHRVMDVDIPTRDGESIPGRLYLPADESAVLPLTVYYHGGGWLLGSIDSHDVTARMLANASGSAVLSVGYRRGPESRFPTAVDDAIDALRLGSRVPQPGSASTTAHIAVAGDSAGGNLAGAVAVYARDNGGPALRHQLLVYPVTTTDLERGMDPQYDGVMLERDELQWHQDNYLPSPEDGHRSSRRHPRRRSDSGLPDTTMILAECDPIRPQGERISPKRSRRPGCPPGATSHREWCTASSGSTRSFPRPPKR